MVLTRSKTKNPIIIMGNLKTALERQMNGKREKPIEIVTESANESNPNNNSNDDGGGDEEILLNESTEEEEMEEEEEFELPEEIRNNKKWKRKADKIIEYIKKRTVTLQDIITSKMNMKHKARLFELYFIYENSMIMTEERILTRQQVYRMFKNYKKEYENCLHQKEVFQQLERYGENYNELFQIQKNILELPTCISNKEIIYAKYCELREKTEIDEDEYHKLKNWIRQAISLPFDRVVNMNIEKEHFTDYLIEIRKKLDKELYGMTKVKEKLMLYIHHKIMNPESKGWSLALVGPPGVGKTSIALCISKCLGLPFEQMAMGGMNNSDMLRGHDYTYVGSKPGEIAKAMIRMKCKNGIIFMDEFEKISENAEMLSCLLHITDFSQNAHFRDHFFSDLTIDLSSIWFIYSMNSLPEDHALRDRIFHIEVEGYSMEDKMNIVRDYLIPKHLKNIGKKEDEIVFGQEALRKFISNYHNREKGIRQLEKDIKDILHKIYFLSAHHKKIQCSFQLPSSHVPITFPFTIDSIVVEKLLQEKHHSLHSKDFLNMFL
jgi:ATP-dependent Lon protease